MCCFSPVSAPASFFARLFGGARSPHVHVADTSIFARLAGDDQCLVYSMQLSVAGEVAMMLPLPVAPGLGDDGASFVNLEAHARFFDDLAALFAPPEAQRSAAKGGSPLRLAPKLVVHEVGSFEASFVPTVRDFSRLDERFRLPESVWEALGDYTRGAWGFAVFRLKPGKKKHIHPMALRFATRDKSRLFFPTVHVHDGRVHETAPFDHALYYQKADAAAPADEAAFFRPHEDYEGLVERGAQVFRRQLRGKLPNRDTWI